MQGLVGSALCTCVKTIKVVGGIPKAFVFASKMSPAINLCYFLILNTLNDKRE